MLGKLLKYDLKWVYKVISVFYILSVFFAGIGRLFTLFDNSLVFDILSKVMFGISIAMMANGVVNCFMRSWVRFANNMYKDESYLTHTLPVSRNTIFCSKFLSAIICTFTSVLVVAVSLAICYYSKENIEVLGKLLEIVATAYNTKTVTFLLTLSVVLMLQIVFIILVGYIGLILGHRRNNNKMGCSVIFGLIIYAISMILILAIVFIVALLNADVMSIFVSNSVSIEVLKTACYICIATYSCYILALYFIGQKLLKSGVNVD